MNEVPNPRMPGTFMAVAVDTYDQENGIHPRFKQVAGPRVGWSLSPLEDGM